MQMTLEELAAIVGGEIIGDAGLAISGATSAAGSRPDSITFVESAEPLCWPDPDALEEAEDEGEDLEIVTLADFLDLWSTGDYHFFGVGKDWEYSHGVTQLSFALPAAPAELDFNVNNRVISWEAGDDLGNCAELVGDGPDDPGPRLAPSNGSRRPGQGRARVR